MRLRDIALAAGLIGAAGLATLIYGALVEAKRLVLERRKLLLPGWPKKLAGIKLAVLADIHLRDKYSEELACRAVEIALAAEPDYILIPGDLIARWKPDTLERARRCLQPLADSGIPTILSMGNHEYENGLPDPLVRLCEEMGIIVLRNQAWRHKGITFAGVDSANQHRAEPRIAMERAHELGLPIITLWHEPDVVDVLPKGSSLMISGHSHGGQFTFPGGFTPMHTLNGRKFVKGFFPKAPTPLYVSRGVGTTGPPSRLNCAPEISLLELVPVSAADK